MPKHEILWPFITASSPQFYAANTMPQGSMAKYKWQVTCGSKTLSSVWMMDTAKYRAVRFHNSKQFLGDIDLMAALPHLYGL